MDVTNLALQAQRDLSHDRECVFMHTVRTGIAQMYADPDGEAVKVGYQQE